MKMETTFFGRTTPAAKRAKLGGGGVRAEGGGECAGRG